MQCFWFPTVVRNMLKLFQPQASALVVVHVEISDKSYMFKNYSGRK